MESILFENPGGTRLETGHAPGKEPPAREEER